jgi:hypothetical protein
MPRCSLLPQLASRQVGYVLLVQALIPLCLSLLPLGFLLLFNLFDIREGRDWLPIFFYQVHTFDVYRVRTSYLEYCNYSI